MNELDGLTLAREDGSPIRVFAMSKGRLQGENPNIWERRFGYGHKPAADRPSLVVPIEVEVKDVGGPVWMEHLNDKAATSRAPAEDGASQPRWLMLDTMTRILGHKKNMTESVAQPNADMVANVPPGERVATWTGMVQREGVEKSVEKRLWEKMTVAAKMAVTDKFSRADLLAWLRQCVKPGRAAEYVALLDLTRSERAYEAWLQRLD